jgi:hypothetical protein
MKKLLNQDSLRVFAVMLLLFLSSSGSIGQKNTVIVKDSKGKGIESITVYLFTTKTVSCKCFPLGGCTFSPSPFDVSTSGNSGHAKFGEKGDPELKPNTTYYAAIDAKCIDPQIQNLPCNDSSNPCGFSIKWAQDECKTNDKGKFDAVSITK